MTVCDQTLNEDYRECAPPCDATCDEPQKLCSLQESCNKRCACADGYVRNDEGVCVEVEQCPAPEPTVPGMTVELSDFFILINILLVDIINKQKQNIVKAGNQATTTYVNL